MCLNAPMAIEEVISLSKMPLFEIAGHGYAHQNTFEDWEKGIHKLIEWLPAGYFERGYGIASPHSVVTQEWVDNNLLNIEKFKYIRTGLRNQHKITQRGLSKIARMSGSCALTYAPIKNSLLPIGNNKLLFSIPVLNPHTYKQVKYLIDKTIQKHGDIILQLHSVIKKGDIYYDDLYSWDYDNFEKLCQYLCELRNKGFIEVNRSIDAV